jgi:chemotaxis protein MotA
VKPDVLTIAGVLIGVLAIFGGNLIEGGGLGSLLQLTAFVIVVGGTAGAVVLQTRLPTLRAAARMAVWVVLPPEDDSEDVIRRMSNWSRLARQDGLLALDKMLDAEQDPFIRHGLQYLVDGTDARSLQRVLELEVTMFEDKEFQAARVFEAAGGYAPTIGILGAVLGLIHTLERLNEPETLGTGIAVAFVATIYGVGLANLVLLPLAAKLKTLIRIRVRRLEMIQEGFVAIAEGVNPRLVESRLRAYQE